MLGTTAALKSLGSLYLLMPTILVWNSPLTGFSSGGDVSLVVWPSGLFFRFSELFVFLMSFAGSFMTCSLFVGAGIPMPMSSWLVVCAVVLFPVVLVSFSEELLLFLLDATFLLLLLGAILLWESVASSSNVRSVSGFTGSVLSIFVASGPMFSKVWFGPFRLPHLSLA